MTNSISSQAVEERQRKEFAVEALNQQVTAVGEWSSESGCCHVEMIVLHLGLHIIPRIWQDAKAKVFLWFLKVHFLWLAITCYRMLPMDSSNQNQTLAVCFFHRKSWNMQNWFIFVFAARWLHSTLRWTTNYPLPVVPLLEKHFEREVDTRRTRTHTTHALATGCCLISSQLWSKSLSLIIVFAKGACLRLQEKHNTITVSNCSHLLSTPKLPWPWLGSPPTIAFSGSWSSE